MLSCAPNMSVSALRRAEGELCCKPPALRFRGVGRLRVGGPRGLDVELYEASGCDQEQLYVCSRALRRCEHALSALPRPDLHAALERAHEVLRLAARARCPESELMVTQESETLFRFHSCDGDWSYHCRARGCELLPVRTK
jgi:hypothetical protein